LLSSSGLNILTREVLCRTEFEVVDDCPLVPSLDDDDDKGDEALDDREGGLEDLPALVFDEDAWDVGVGVDG